MAVKNYPFEWMLASFGEANARKVLIEFDRRQDIENLNRHLAEQHARQLLRQHVPRPQIRDRLTARPICARVSAQRGQCGRRPDAAPWFALAGVTGKRPGLCCWRWRHRPGGLLSLQKASA